jgi:hypothetical protein
MKKSVSVQNHNSIHIVHFLPFESLLDDLEEIFTLKQNFEYALLQGWKSYDALDADLNGEVERSELQTAYQSFMMLYDVDQDSVLSETEIEAALAEVTKSTLESMYQEK